MSRAVIAASLLLVMLVAPAVNAGTQLSAYQDSAVDLSGWRDILRQDGLTVRNTAATPLFLNEVSSPEKTVLVIAGMEKSYGSRERAMIDDFLHAGGTMIMGDGGGRVPNALSKEYGVLYFGVPLRDQTFEFNQSFIRMNVEDWGLSPLVVNPTALLCESEECTLGRMATSSNQSFLDLDRDGVIGAGDDIGPFTMMVRVSVGAGTAIFLPSAAFGTNDLLQETENLLFMQKLIQDSSPEANLVVFDESRHETPAGEKWLVSGLTILGGFSSVPIARFLVAATFLMAAIVLLRRAKPFDSWRHVHNLGAPTPDPDRGHAAERLADLMAMKIKLDHQLVDPTKDDLLRLAPDPEVRRLLTDPTKVNATALKEIMQRHLPKKGIAAEANHGGHATQSATTPSPPDEAPVT